MNAFYRNLPLSRAHDGRDTLVDATLLAGRVGLGLLFAVSGFGKISGFAGTAAYMAPTTLIFHSPVGPEAQAQMTQFLKNLSILGGMLYVAALGPGAWSADRR